MIKEIPAKGLEYIYEKGEIIAVILRDDFESDKVSFFTPENFSQQLGYLPHKKGHKIRPHRHRYNRREVHFTQEMILVKRGKVRVDLYDGQKNYICSEILSAGDIILLCGGGHGFEILEDAVMIELKQGPYTGESDKERLDGVD